MLALLVLVVVGILACSSGSRRSSAALGRNKTGQPPQPQQPQQQQHRTMALVSHQMMHKPAALDAHAHINGASSSAGSSASLNGSGKLPLPNGYNAVPIANGSGVTNAAAAAAAAVASNAILAAAQPYYHAPVSPQEFQPDRPIGYGAFGVVW